MANEQNNRESTSGESSNQWVWWALGIAAAVVILFWIMQPAMPAVPNTGTATSTEESSAPTSVVPATVSSVLQSMSLYFLFERLKSRPFRISA